MQLLLNKNEKEITTENFKLFSKKQKKKYIFFI